MSAIFEKPVTVSQIVTTSLEEARALDDPIRIMMLEMLSKTPMSIIDIVEELRKRGVNKAPTTIRHHLDMLKKASLIELTKAEDVKGGVLKYYASKAKFFGHNVPKDFDTKFVQTIEKVRDRIDSLIEKIMTEEADEIRQVAEKMKPCPYCKTQDFIEYVIITILNRAITEAVQSSKFQRLL